MSNGYDNTNRIAIFVNNREGRADNAPMLTGKVNVEGVDYQVSLWAQKSNRDGTTFWAGNIKPSGALTNNGGLPPGASAPAPEAAPEEPFTGATDADIPF